MLSYVSRWQLCRGLRLLRCAGLNTVTKIGKSFLFDDEQVNAFALPGIKWVFILAYLKCWLIINLNQLDGKWIWS